MRILCVDVGTGTQDILFYDSEKEIENCFKLVLPSPTVIIANRVRQLTSQRTALLLGGRQMGGGPSAWAIRDHLAAGLPVSATPAAAQTIDDDLDAVRASGVAIVSEDEAAAMTGRPFVKLGDFDYGAILQAVRPFGVPEPDGVAVAVFDHGNAPPGYSDRRFRFDYLANRLDGGLTSLAFQTSDIPPDMTRLQAVAESIPAGMPALVMDTGPAAILGALDDPLAGSTRPQVTVNIGNFHTLAYLIDRAGIAGLFEHHSGEIDQAQLVGLIRKLVSGEITNDEVFGSQGHGAISRRNLGDRPAEHVLVSVTGPRRRMLAGSVLRPHFATPFGDMMLAGCFGLLRAWEAKNPDHQVRL